MTRKCLTNEQRGQMWGRLEEVAHRVEGEVIPFKETLDALQLIVEGEIPTPLFARDMRKESGWELVEEGSQVPVDFSIADLERKSFLNHDENYINGKELQNRAATLGANFGQHHAEYLLEHQDQISHWYWRDAHLIFPGTVWRARRGGLFVPYLRWFDEGWSLVFYRLDCRFNSRFLLVRFRV